MNFEGSSLFGKGPRVLALHSSRAACTCSLCQVQGKIFAIENKKKALRRFGGNPFEKVYEEDRSKKRSKVVLWDSAKEHNKPHFRKKRELHDRETRRYAVSYIAHPFLVVY